MTTTVESGAMAMFERELATYESHKADLLKNEGQYVVIRGEEILGVYPSNAEGFDAGLKAYGPEKFLLQRISRDETGLYNPFVGCVFDPTLAYPTAQ